MSCKHDCGTPAVFPAAIDNRPGLGRIGYRIGDYARYRQVMLAALDAAPALRAWTHRGPDDPGIALIEGAAEVAEVLTFYQELYANEAFLRTASWRESVADLVALTGYRPAPGVGGQAVFAVAVDGEAAVTVPAGFGFRATLADGDAPAEFEALAPVEAHPSLNRFRLYRPRKPAANVTAGLTRLELAAVDGAADIAARGAAAPEPGDRLMIVPATTAWDEGGGAYDASSPQAAAEIVIVKAVAQVLDRIVIDLEGALTVDRGAAVSAYRLGRSFRHFGHAAPATVAEVDDNGIYTAVATVFDRYVAGADTSSQPSVYSALPRDDMPLDTEVDDLAVGAPFIAEGRITFSGQTAPVAFTVVRDIVGVHSDTLTWAGVSAPTTVARLDDKLIANDAILGETTDIRRLRFHETVGPPLSLQAPSDWPSGPFPDTQLRFHGTHAQARLLAARDLLLVHDDGRVEPVRVASTTDDFDPAGRDTVNSWLWPVTLASAPAFVRDAFDEANPAVTVYGNLVPADQGRTGDETVLGSGDARQRFQTFKLPKAPLTHFIDTSATPAQVPELAVHVDGVRWQRVPVLFGRGPSDPVYVVRQDADGESYVQFGDGRTGARLPSGRGNVVARWRTGIGARGALKAGEKPSGTGRLKALDEVFLPGRVVGGAGPESTDSARTNAPARMQSLGRMVGLADYEAEAASLPGVAKVSARYAAPAGSPQVRLVVLTAGGTAAEAAAVEATLRGYNRCRGASRYPVVVVPGRRRYLHAAVTVGYDPARRRADVEQAVLDALGVMAVDGSDNGTGLLALARRRFGQDLHRSQLVAAVQDVTGVSWVRPGALQAMPPGTPPASDPADLAIPTAVALQSAVACPADRVLALYRDHLTLAFVADADSQECDP